MSESEGASSELGYVLHTYPYKETSQLVEAFARVHGRLSLVARGAKRASANRPALMPFQPFSFAWKGRGELKTLVELEAPRIEAQLAGDALLAGFYVNELILKLTAKEDPHEALFDFYEEALTRLREITLARTRPAAQNTDHGADLAKTLRWFEVRLLRELGYGLALTHEADSGTPLDATRYYSYVAHRGALRSREGDPLAVRGKTLLDMAADDYSDARSVIEAKGVLRRVIAHHLQHRALHTRQIVRDLKDTVEPVDDTTQCEPQ